MADSPLEDLLRSHPITDGVIQLSILDGQWMCSISHRQGHMTHNLGRFAADPVDAMRAALIEDERHDRECRRKYAGSVKLGQPTMPAQADDFDDDFGSLAQPSVSDDDFGDLM